MADVAVIGTGVMGSAVARACVGAGLSVAAWNRTPERGVALAPQGVDWCATVDEAVRSSPVVVLALLNYAISRQVLEPAGPGLAGRIVVQTASGVPDQVEPLATWVADAGGRYLEAAILNYPQTVGTEQCFTVYAGPAEWYGEISPLTRALGGTALYLGEDAPYAKAYHSVSAAFYYGIVNTLLECSALATSLGVPLDDFARSVPLYQPGLQHTIDVGVELMGRGDYRYEQAPLTTHIDILRNLSAVAEESGVAGSFLPVLRDRVQRALDDGFRREHVAVLHQQFRATPARRTEGRGEPTRLTP
ncbi:NAD(P)-dependent oxidoreductase [Streptoalloteichus hindustanus]|uniref:3-hydroxyisobutyrate dehydrogenase n=1 Tax=Streptoalloteichus hindustanus TaxID=2017 RepID=A0A1M5P2Y3_STRHI|nr:NAD(P)-binding domain-containing protein [Streptoalloteichus hindustanus]SHG96150.1 3-hydroxyisobutyrate dehydrogenase [Streptoalloteichus hindustanus]